MYALFKSSVLNIRSPIKCFRLNNEQAHTPMWYSYKNQSTNNINEWRSPKNAMLQNNCIVCWNARINDFKTTIYVLCLYIFGLLFVSWECNNYKCTCNKLVFI